MPEPIKVGTRSDAFARRAVDVGASVAVERGPARVLAFDDVGAAVCLTPDWRLVKGSADVVGDHSGADADTMPTIRAIVGVREGATEEEVVAATESTLAYWATAPRARGGRP